MQEVVVAARQSVAHSPELLPALKQAGVVDSGGQGFCTVLEGVWRYVRGESEIEIVLPETLQPGQPAPEVKKGVVTVEEEFGYEVVFLLSGDRLGGEQIR